MVHESLVLVLALREALPEPDALVQLADAVPVWVRMEREGRSACLVARMRHGDPPERFRMRVREWGAERGWAVTVAPCAPPM
jgi:hypothetical protein